MTEPLPVCLLLERIGLESDPEGLVTEAVTHSSYVNEHSNARSNGRLEFLGDAVLGLVIAQALFARCRSLDEGDLTRLRISLVREESLAIAAARLGLGEFLRLGKGEIQHGGKSRPSLLADAFEATIGAVYLISGIEAAAQFVLRWLDVSLEARDLDSKSLLQQILQREGPCEIRYVETRHEGPDHNKTFYVSVSLDGTVLAEGKGHSKKQAEQDAAAKALAQMRVREEREVK